MTMVLHPAAARTKRKITRRLLPFLFLLYITAYLDRVNVSFAGLEMTRELKFSNEVFGFGAGIFFVGYFMLDGFDFGVGMALPFLGKDEVDRRVMINTIGPVWDLNETWVIVAGAALFAAFPDWYATLFSGFYLALLLILLALIARGVSFEYRHQRPESRWKKWFDGMIVAGSAVPAFLWGVAFSNIVQGVALDAHHDYTGTLFDLLEQGYSLEEFLLDFPTVERAQAVSVPELAKADLPRHAIMATSRGR